MIVSIMSMLLEQNPPYCKRTVWATELFEVLGLFAEHDAVSVELAVVELDL
jgi:hypothetical protein